MRAKLGAQLPFSAPAHAGACLRASFKQAVETRTRLCSVRLARKSNSSISRRAASAAIAPPHRERAPAPPRRAAYRIASRKRAAQFLGRSRFFRQLSWTAALIETPRRARAPGNSESLTSASSSRVCDPPSRRGRSHVRARQCTPLSTARPSRRRRRRPMHVHVRRASWQLARGLLALTRDASTSAAPSLAFTEALFEAPVGAAATRTHTLAIVHGLLGSARNWGSFVRRLGPMLAAATGAAVAPPPDASHPPIPLPPPTSRSRCAFARRRPPLLPPPPPQARRGAC